MSQENSTGSGLRLRRRLSAREITLVAGLSSASVAVAYFHGLVTPYLPNVEFMTVIVFVSGYCFGIVVGLLVGAIAQIVYQLIPYPFTNPAATVTVISPVLLVIMAALGALYGLAGGLLGRRHRVTRGTGWGKMALAITFLLVVASSYAVLTYLLVVTDLLLSLVVSCACGATAAGLLLWRRKAARFTLVMAFWGTALTFLYDVLSSIGFYVAYPVYPSVWDAIYLTFVPLYYPFFYPPILHTVANAVIFGIVAPPLIGAVSRFKEKH